MPKKIVKFKDFKKIFKKLDRCHLKNQQHLLLAQKARLEYNMHMQLTFDLIQKQNTLQSWERNLRNPMPKIRTARMMTGYRREFIDPGPLSIDIQFPKYAWINYE